MANEPIITVVGNLAGDPELRFTQAGHAVANFTIAQTPRNFDRDSNQWVDDETLWVRASVWREAAENVAESLTKGMRVMAYGKLKARSFETKDGQQRTNWELEVEEVGPSLRWTSAQVAPSGKNAGGGGWNNQAQQGGGGWGGQSQNQAQGQPQSAPAGQQGQWGQGPGQGNSAPQNPGQGNGPWGGQPGGGWDQGQDSPPPF